MTSLSDSAEVGSSRMRIRARFDSAEDARRNSERPEQDAWWRATAALFDGPVSFHESEEVQVKTHGDVGGARFVQIMEGHVTDRERAKRLEDLAEPVNHRRGGRRAAA